MKKFPLQRHKPKLACPSCGRKKCFTPYVDNATGQILDPSCGICDHLNSCGYHLPPRMLPRHILAAHRTEPAPPPPPKPKEPDIIVPLPPALVDASRSNASAFAQWLLRMAPDTAPQALDRYHVGATRAGHVIFWQIDIHQQPRTGKIMAYTPDGHRCGHPSWVHTRLQNRGQLPGAWQLHQCLFGEHLLTDQQKTVFLVESEKTALLCAARYPQHLWLASGGCQGLTAEKMAPLAHRHFIALPDSGCYHKWRQRLLDLGLTHFAISPALEQYPPNTDIADLIDN